MHQPGRSDGGPQQLDISFGGSLLVVDHSNDAAPWTTQAYSVTATRASELLSLPLRLLAVSGAMAMILRACRWYRLPCTGTGRDRSTRERRIRNDADPPKAGLDQASKTERRVDPRRILLSSTRRLQTP